MIADVASYAFRNIRRRKLRAWLTVLGVFIGIAAVVSLIGLGEGLRNAVIGQFSILGTDLLRVTPLSGGGGPPGVGAQNPLEVKNVAQLKGLKEAEDAAGRLVNMGSAEFNDMVSFGWAMSMPDGDARKLMERAVGYKATEGRLLKDGDRGRVVIGETVAQEDTFGKRIVIGNKLRLNGRDFTVIGILKKSGSFIVDSTVLMNEQDHRLLFDRNDGTYDFIAVQVNPLYDTDDATVSVERLMRRIRDVDEGEEDFEVVSPQQVIENFNQTLFAVTLFLYVIVGISLLVGGIGIMTTMYTAVVERTKEIGILKSLGAKNHAIFSMFLIESGLIGMVGGITGTIAGSAASMSFAAVGRAALGSDLISVHLSPLLIVGALLFSFILGSVFGTVPAYKASRLNPVDALRHVK